MSATAKQPMKLTRLLVVWDDEKRRPRWRTLALDPHIEISEGKEVKYDLPSIAKAIGIKPTEIIAVAGVGVGEDVPIVVWTMGGEGP